MGKLFDLIKRSNDVARIVQTLSGLAFVSGPALAVYLYLTQLTWWQAIIHGASLSASLVLTIAGIDYLYRKYTVNKKIVANQLTVIAVGEENGVRGAQLFIHLKNTSVREIWVRFERIHCQIENIGHDRYVPQDPMAIQPENAGGMPIPVIQNLPRDRQRYTGFVEVEVKYGKAKDKLNGTYRTHAQFDMAILRVPDGRLLGGIQLLGGGMGGVA